MEKLPCASRIPAKAEWGRSGGNWERFKWTPKEQPGKRRLPAAASSRAGPLGSKVAEVTRPADIRVKMAALAWVLFPRSSALMIRRIGHFSPASGASAVFTVAAALARTAGEQPVAGQGKDAPLATPSLLPENPGSV